jgi:poly(hydroxyalkanoate) depolymerase family esterase
MWQLFKRWLGRLLSVSRLIGRPAGRWVEGSHADSHQMFLFFPMPKSKRNYWLYLPGSYSATGALPLVVMLHGCKQDAAAFASGTRMNELADREGFLVLYPEQRRSANAHRCWNWFDSSAQRAGGEAEVIAGMVREVTQTHAVDPGRVYIAGLSAGGAMASIMASCYGNLFAACAVHSGLMFRAAESVSQAARAMRHGSRASTQDTARQALAQKDFSFVPALVIQGTADSVVNPLNADQLVQQFVAIAELADAGNGPVTAVSSDQSGGGRRAYEIFDYRCGDRLLSRKVLIDGLDHAWSGGDGAHPFNDPKGPDATRMIWQFFCAFQRSGQ